MEEDRRRKLVKDLEKGIRMKFEELEKAIKVELLVFFCCIFGIKLP